MITACEEGHRQRHYVSLGQWDLVRSQRKEELGAGSAA